MLRLFHWHSRSHEAEILAYVNGATHFHRPGEETTSKVTVRTLLAYVMSTSTMGNSKGKFEYQLLLWCKGWLISYETCNET